MPNILDEYLIKLGAVVDQSGMASFQRALTEASATVDATAFGMSKSFFKAQTEIVSGFATIGGAALGLADKVAMADQEYRLFALHMYMSKDAARSLKVAMDALGQPLENLAWDAELRERTRQLIADQKAMAPGGDFEVQMRKIRDIRFEFTRMEVELKYLGMNVVTNFMRSLGLGPDDLLKKLRSINDWITHNMPTISQKLSDMFLPVWYDIKDVFKATGTALKDTADAFSNLIGLLTGDTAITKSTDSLEKFGLAVQKVSHIFAVFAETVANIEDLLAHLISALVDIATGNFKGAGQELKASLADINARTIGAGVMVASAFLAPELLPEEAEAAGAAGVGAEATEAVAPGFFARLAAKGVGLLGRHPIIAGGLGANFGDLATGGSANAALIAAMQAQESGALGMAARSPKGAIGTMQLMPPTAAALGVNPYDAAQNVAGGTAYINQMLKRYGGNVAEALGAYNAGPGRMDAFLAGKATLPSETQQYIAKVLGRSGKTGDVNIGGITIHITQPGASADEIARKTASETAKQVQRNLQEFSQLSYSY